MIYDIGIVDTKKVIGVIKDVYNIDFSGFALTALKRRLLYVMNENNYSSIVDFISNIENNQLLFEKYLSLGIDRYNRNVPRPFKLERTPR
jgi:hypothetical protein